MDMCIYIYTDRWTCTRGLCRAGGLEVVQHLPPGPFVTQEGLAREAMGTPLVTARVGWIVRLDFLKYSILCIMELMMILFSIPRNYRGNERERRNDGKMPGGPENSA